MTVMTVRAERRRAVPRWQPWLFLLVVLWPLLAATPALAHLKLESSDPADGEVLTAPASVVTLTFTRTAEPAGTGFRILDERGAVVESAAEKSEGGVVWRLRPAEPLGPGAYGVQWRIAAGDAHTMSGTVRFRVAGTAAPAAGAAEQAPPAASPVAPPADPAALDAALDAALTADESRSWDLLAALGRWVSFAGVLVAVGALVVVVTTLVGSEGDVRLSERVVRTGAAAAVTGALLEGGALLSTLGTGTPVAPLAAAGLRLAGGLALAVSLRLVARRAGGRRSHDVPTLPGGVARERPPGGGRRVATQLALTPPVTVGRVRGVPVRPAAAVAACTALLVSFVLDGHTAVVGPWPLIAAAALAHTAAAAVWVGGVLLLATLLLRRARAGVPTGAGELAVRFSVPATASVVLAGAAGIGLAALIVDTPGQLVSTPWGRVLLVKLALVAVVALLGYANNRYALPALDAWQPHSARLLRRTVAIEGVVMVLVVAVTAVLVGSQA